MRMPTIHRPRYADVAATLALVLAMGTGAHAAATVGTADIKDGAVTTAKLHVGAVHTGKIADGSVTSRKIDAGAVGSSKLASGSVTASKLGPSSVSGRSVASNSLSLADLVGINQAGNISFSLSANSCGTLNVAVSGAVAGQAAFLTWTTTPPPSIILGPLQVVSTNSITTQACNVSGSAVSLSNVGVRIVTFG
jgi:hypothetical protein